jgi:hypothetical protein
METTFNEKPILSGKGGWRPGAGRKKGSKSLSNLPKKAILEYTSPQELKNMVERAKKLTKKDPKMLQWYLEQIFGKAKVVEKETGKTTNNIAVFLDKLEQERLNPPIEGTSYIGDPLETIYVGDPINNGSTTFKQGFQTETPIYNNGQKPEQDTVSAE